MIKVIITQLPTESFSYFQWFLLGLYELKKEHKISLSFRINIFDRIVLLFFNNKYVAGVARRLIHRFIKVPRYNLVGHIIYNNHKKTFTIDSKDSPFIFTVDLLEKCDVYIKNQCPIEIEESGFPITQSIRVPFSDVKFGENNSPNNNLARLVSDRIYQLRHKIHPGMVGPRRLAWSCKYNALNKQYQQYLKSQSNSQSKKLIAYFGNALWPKATPNISLYDLDWENDLMAFLSSNGNHPNQKRELAVNILNSLPNDYDGRLITDGLGVRHKELAVPLADFCDFISSYQYNLNISGFRLSIPNRFIESFIGGTAIVTDRLYVKWFQPFNCEVYETVDMGYNPSVDWDQFKTDITHLPNINKQDIIKLYNKKWAPKVFANYIIATTLNN